MESLKDGNNNSLEVLVSDTDEITVRLLAADLRRQHQFEVSECPAEIVAIIASIARRRPSVLLLGLRFRDPLIETLTLLRRVHGEFPWIRTIILSEGTGRDLITEVFRAGAKGFFDRAAYDPVLLCRCIQCVASGQVWAKSEVLAFVLDAFADTPVLRDPKGLESLTPREREVAQLVGEGLCNSEVAQRLGLSIHTVKNYLFNVFDKTGVSSRAELILYLLSNSTCHKDIAPSTTNHQPRQPSDAQSTLVVRAKSAATVIVPNKRAS